MYGLLGNVVSWIASLVALNLAKLTSLNVLTAAITFTYLACKVLHVDH